MMVPFHPGRDISPTLLRKTAADIHLTLCEFLQAHLMPVPRAGTESPSLEA